MNNICLIGRITQDPELKTTTTGKSVCNFDIAVKRPFVNDITDFFTCICWDKKAEIFAKYVSKGRLIGIKGYLYTRKWQDKNGNNRLSYEINVEDFDFCESKNSNNGVNIDPENDPLNDFSEKLENLNAKNDVLEDAIDMDLPF